MTQVKDLPLIQEVEKTVKRPVKILQFGEGNFLRAFIDWIINSANKAGSFDGGVAIVQPIAQFGRAKELADANCLYTLYLQGLQDGKAVRQHEVIKTVQDAFNPYTDYEKFLAYAVSDDLQCVISNTTEAGIAFDPTDTNFSKTPNSYPGKLLALLKARYEAGKKGIFIVPCELIDHNGETLKEVMVKLAKHNNFDAKFINYVENENMYFNTLVDRIVPGYPRDNAEQFQLDLGYQDQNMVVGEIFHLWCIDAQTVADQKVAKANLEALKKFLGTEAAGLNVLFVDSIVPYKQRKVKILNGSHTTLVPVSYLAGIDAVKETIEDPQLGKFVKEFIFDEVIPTIDIPRDQMEAYSNSVLERYMNPYVHHLLMSIALNSSTKYKERVLPSVLQNIQNLNTLPKHALFSLAALMVFYRGTRLSDNAQIAIQDTNQPFLDLINGLWAQYDKDKNANALVTAVLGYKAHWGVDLNEFDDVNEYVTASLEAILAKGIREAIKEIVD
ncbi:MAG: tagaturonate reductase [Acholeplasmatales bacterium]|nr:tagaturonate reductase [Acholeplasmatales bacterium]